MMPSVKTTIYALKTFFLLLLNLKSKPTFYPGLLYDISGANCDKLKCNRPSLGES